MDAAITGALIGAAGSIGEGIFSSGQAKAQRRWSEKMWHKQNAYNTPLAQMERLRKAGLNPALMYGKGNVGNAMQAAAVQQAKTPNFSSNLTQGVQTGINMDIARKQKELMDEQKALTAAQAFKAKIEGSYRVKDYDLRAEMQTHSINHLLYKNRQIDQDIEQSKSVVSLNEVKSRLTEAQIELTSAQRIQVYNMIQKVQQDMELQQFLIEEHKRGFGSKTLVSLGNLMDINNVNSSDARWKALGVIISSIPVGRAAKGAFTAAKKSFNKWYSKGGNKLVDKVINSYKTW